MKKASFGKVIVSMVLVSGFQSISAFADLSACQGQYDSFRSSMGDCAMGTQSACDNVCAMLTPQVQQVQCPPAQVVASCSQSDLENARTQGQKEVLRDLSLSVTESTPTFYGTSKEECAQRAVEKAEPVKQKAIQECNAKGVVIKNCQIVGDVKVVAAEAAAPAIKGHGHVSVNSTKDMSEADCRAAAVTAAKEEALNQCRLMTGYDCTQTNAAPIVSHHLIKHAFSDGRACDADVFAAPPASVHLQCTATVRAQNFATVSADE